MPQTQTQRRNKRGSPQDKFSAELTSSQLVIGICILLLFGLACFLVGVLVGKFETAPRMAQAAQQTPAPARTVVVPPPEPEPAPEPAPAATNRQPDPETEPVQVPPVTQPEPVESSPAAETEPVAEEPAEVPESEPDQSEPPEPEPEPDEPEPEKPVKALPLAPIEPVEDDDSPAPEPVAEAEVNTTGKLTVQVGAFSKESYAKQAKERIEKATGWPVYLVDSPQRKLTMVHAGHFDTQDDAESAKTRMIDELGYDGSYVTEHSIALTKAPS